MNRIVATSSLLFLAIPACAQNEFPKLELFAGYSFQTVFTSDRLHPIPRLPNLELPWFQTDPEREHSHGLTFGISRNLSKHFGVTSTFGWERASDMTAACAIPFVPTEAPQLPCLEQRESRASEVLVGPRFTSRKGRVTHFAHTLIGTNLLLGRNSASWATAASRYFAMSYGGGVDVALNDRLSIRTFQADYLSARGDLYGRPHVRVQTGIVLTFGRR